MVFHRSMRTFLLPCVALVAACGGAHDATEKELGELRSEVVKLRADSAALHERVDALEASRAAGRGAASATPAGAAPSGDRPNLDVVRLTPEPAEGDVDADGPRTVIKSAGKGAVVEETAGKGGGEGQRDYDQALEALRAKSYDKALAGFDSFLERFPTSPNADNAVYWRGECHLAKANPKKAVEQFEEVVQRYPSGNKVPDALLKLALTYAKLGERAKSEDAKKRLLADYPTSEAARKLAPGGAKGGSGGGAKPPSAPPTSPNPPTPGKGP